MDISLRGIDNVRILYLNFPSSTRDAAVLWLIGHFLEYVEEKTVIQGRRISGNSVYGYMKYKRLAEKHTASKDPGLIPGLDY
jgi:hypothetical protein